MGEDDVKTRLIDEAVNWMLSWFNVYTFMEPPAWVFRWKEGGLAAVAAVIAGEQNGHPIQAKQKNLPHPEPSDVGVLTSASSANLDVDRLAAHVVRLIRSRE